MSSRAATRALLGVVAGGVLMFWLDPQHGRRRRAVLRTRAVSAVRRGVTAGAHLVADVEHRAEGVAARTRARVVSLHAAPVVSGGQLTNRIRARIGHVVTHPGALRVVCADGYVTLMGPVLADEIPGLLRAVQSVPGVKAVSNRLEVHETRGGVPGLQGIGRRTASGFAAPRWRLAYALTGGAVGLSAFARDHALLRTARALVGAAVVARAVFACSLSELVGVSGARRVVDFRKRMLINAPLERVFRFWRQPVNFPKFMSHVRGVEEIGDDRYRWTVDGPAGAPVHWISRVVSVVPNTLITWRSEPGGIVDSAGFVRFREMDDGSTHVVLRMSYGPALGVLGHGLARLFRVDPKRQLDDDLARLKIFLETGRAARDAAASVTRRRSARRDHDEVRPDIARLET
jgi:uncharacterized membrane protein